MKMSFSGSSGQWQSGGDKLTVQKQMVRVIQETKRNISIRYSNEKYSRKFRDIFCGNPKKNAIQMEVLQSIPMQGNLFENAFPVKRILFHFNPANLIYELHKFYALKGKGINDPEREIIQILLSDWQPLNSWNGNIFTFSLLSVSGKIKLSKFLPKFNAALLRIPCMESKLFKQIIGIFKTF